MAPRSSIQTPITPPPNFAFELDRQLAYQMGIYTNSAGNGTDIFSVTYRALSQTCHQVMLDSQRDITALKKFKDCFDRHLITQIEKLCENSTFHKNDVVRKVSATCQENGIDIRDEIWNKAMARARNNQQIQQP